MPGYTNDEFKSMVRGLIREGGAKVRREMAIALIANSSFRRPAHEAEAIVSRFYEILKGKSGGFGTAFRLHGKNMCAPQATVFVSWVDGEGRNAGRGIPAFVGINSVGAPTLLADGDAEKIRAARKAYDLVFPAAA